jgi:dTMP kinase
LTGGIFVAFEGGEGAGKSTQIGRAASWLRKLNRDVVETREPGGTPLGREVRKLVLDPGGHVTPRTEALLYAADRAQHVETVIRPALAAGKIVLTDRYADSTLAYQGAGRGLADARLITTWATGGLLPDLTVLLDLGPEVGLRRANLRAVPDRLEGASLAFHQAVRDGFRALAAETPQRYAVIDAALDADTVTGLVQDAISGLL